VTRWLRGYQSIGAGQSSISLADRREYLDLRLRQLEGRALSAAERAATLARFDRLAAEIGTATVPAVRIHADLTPRNIVIDDRLRVTALDFTMAKDGPAHHDVSHLYLHMELMANRHRARAADIRAFQAGLLQADGSRSLIDDPLFKLMLMQHSVCHVALIAEKRLPLLDAVYRWFLRRRWRLCAQMSGERILQAA
jgi:hypothetical protein